MKTCMALPAILILLSTPRLSAAPTTFQLGDQGGIAVPVMMNGHGPFPVLIDTGATHSAVTASVAAAIGAPAVATSNVISPAGGTIRTVVAVDELVIGPHEVDIVLASVVPDGAFDAKGAIRGLIGQDVLAMLRYTLDFKRHVIEWHEQVVPTRGIALGLAFEHGRFLVSLPQAGHTMRLVPDSGAGGLVLFTAAEDSNIIDTGRTVELLTVGARLAAREVRVRELRIGARTLRDVAAVTLDRPGRDPAEGDGLLPLHFFDRVTFDGPAKTLILDLQVPSLKSHAPSP